MGDDSSLLSSSATTRLNSTNNSKNDSYRFDIIFLKHFIQVCRPLTKQSVVLTILCFLLFMKLLEEYCAYQVGLITSHYYKILAEKNLKGFFQWTLKSVGLIFLISLVKSSNQYISSILQVTCRQKLTDYLHELYFFKNNFYKLNVLCKAAADNPDQRITQDVDKFTTVLSTVIPTVCIAPFTIGYYTYTAYVSTDWIGPVGVFAYFLIGTIINKFLMSPIVNIVYQQEKREGYFRFKHMRIRVDAESIAFQDGSEVEHKYTKKSLDSLIHVQNRLFLKQYPLDISVNCFNYLGSIVSFFILAVPIFSGRYDSLSVADLSALISKNAFVSIYLIMCFSQLVSLSDNFVTLAGTTHRIALLEKSLLKLGADDVDLDGSKKDASYQRPQGMAKEPLININSVSYHTLEGHRQLIANLSLEVCSGKNLLIVGSSGCGKTSLLRILKGLWQASAGDSYIHHPQAVFFVPQKSLLTDGTLRQQIVYPQYTGFDYVTTAEDDACLIQYLQLVDLMHVYHRAGGLDEPVDWNWYDVLSPGEVQRLCFIRMLYHRPLVALLDESVSAVGTDMEEKLYWKCRELQITVVSIGHRKSLFSYHDELLTFGEEGTWTLERLIRS